jgi:uncharacterized repeat protein (TIGR02543 family)
MKKKNLFLSIIFSLLLIFSAQTFNASKTAYAKYDQVITYTVSASAGKYNVTSTTSDDQNQTVTEVALNLDTLDLAFEAIQTDATNKEVDVIINFDSITLTSDMTIPFNEAYFRGTINLDSYSILFVSSTTKKTVSFENLTLNATGDQSLVKAIRGTFTGDEVEQRLTINLSNVKFNSTSTADTYAVYFETNQVNFNVADKLVHQTKYFYNYNHGVLVSISHTLNLTEQASGKISIPVPYNLNVDYLINDFQSSTEYLDLVELDDFYTCEAGDINSGRLAIKCKINTVFDTNGGELSNTYPSGLEYNSKTDIMFPTDAEITKENNTLKGYLGKVVVNGTTYYFDKTAISTFAATGFDEDVVAEHFFTQIEDDDEYSYFNSYKYDSTETDPSYLAIKYFISRGEGATFIADWEPTVYTITFDANEGTCPVTSISKIFGENITLPTPTREGYTFNGWFDGTNPNKYELTTMPNTNLDLVASWTVNTHKLILVLDNGSNNIEIDVNYGESIAIADIPELDGTLYSKTGHEFYKWFSNSTFSTEYTLETMPDEDVYAYATWNVKMHQLQMNYNNKHNMTIFHTESFAYGADISSLASMVPIVDGYTFLGWYTDTDGEFSYTFNTMPDENVVVYAYWSYVDFKLTFYYNDSVYVSFTGLNVGDVIYGPGSKITFPSNPTLDGFNFKGWFIDPEFTEEFSLDIEQTMPARNFNIYAKMVEKQTIEVNTDVQTYEITKFHKYTLRASTTDCLVEYFVNGQWTQELPTKTGSYNIRISRAEDENYKALLVVIENGLVVNPDPIDLSWVYVLGYAITIVEIIAILFVLVLIKRKRALSSLAIALPFGLIPTGVFVNIIISFVLAIAGFVTLIVLLVKLNRITIYEDTRSEEEKLEERISKIKDVSTNDSIDKNVDDLLRKEGFIDKE